MVECEAWLDSYVCMCALCEQDKYLLDMDELFAQVDEKRKVSVVSCLAWTKTDVNKGVMCWLDSPPLFRSHNTRLCQ